jgi:isochorismate pyruvate lyase
MKSAENCKSIEEIRLAIDTIDHEIIRLLGERYKYVKTIVRFKEPTQESIIAKSRFDAVIASRRKMAEECGLDPDMIERMYRDLMNHFIQEELKIINPKT